ncbi:MAG: dienelactone hydrolase family protein [Cyanobium sp.]
MAEATRAVPPAVEGASGGEPSGDSDSGAALPEPRWRAVDPALAAAQQQAEPVPLRCWLALPEQRPVRGGVLVLPEVFGVNAWVRSVAERLAAEGYAALAVPLFARTAPDLELGYDDACLALGRSHKERTSAGALLCDVARAGSWLAKQMGDPEAPLGCIGFCFGGHVAMLAASLQGMAASIDCYGAGVGSGRPGGGPPTLELLPQIPGRLLCFCGDRDPLLPEAEVQTIEAALACGPDPDRHRLIRMAGAGHGYLCEARADHHPEAAARTWPLVLAFLAESLPQRCG